MPMMRRGNRTLYDDTVTSQSLTYSGTSNRLTAIASQSVTTDSNGNITSIHGMTLAYDAHNRLSSATVGSTVTNYAYNGIGERVTKTTGSNTRHYFYGAEQQLLAEYDASGNVEREYIYLSGQPVVMLDHSGSGIDIYWIHNDHLGRPLALTDEVGDVVWKLTNADAFGNAASINEDPDNDSTNLVFNFRFPGQYFDTETGLHYNYYRDYDPRTGRYIESDPIGLEGGSNTYGYVLQNPGGLMDPRGLAAHCVAWPIGTAACAAQSVSAAYRAYRAYQAAQAAIAIASNLDADKTEEDDRNEELECPDPNKNKNDKCKRLAERIENIRRNINRRESDLVENPHGLPERADDQPLSESRYGHQVLIEHDWQNLKKLEKQFIDECMN